MKKIFWFCLALMLSFANSAVYADAPAYPYSHDKSLLNWMVSNVSSSTGMPYSFDIKDESKPYILSKMGSSDSTTGIIERIIVDKGISIYDAALWQIVLAQQSEGDFLKQAERPIDIYWEGVLGEFYNIRAGGFTQQFFIYDLNNYARVSSDLSRIGERGFIFRILNADGDYFFNDPLDGKNEFEDYPNWSRLHWEDWKPIAGENAWVVLAAMHLYHKKYFDKDTQRYAHDNHAREMRLAKELARAAIILQADNGGIRMAPIGTYFYSLERPLGSSLEEFIRQFDEQGRRIEHDYNRFVDDEGQMNALLNSLQMTWYFYEQSTENNLSWYAAFRALYEVTLDPQYEEAMKKIEGYLKSVWNAQENYFYQGAHFVEGNWKANTKYFATDVQTWAIDKLGPAKIDAWFGEGASYRMWQKTKEVSGLVKGEDFLGVGFSAEQDRISIEWTMGAIYAMQELAHYYVRKEPRWAKEVLKDAVSMRRSVEGYRVSLDSDLAAYPYSTKRDWIPFGWFSHHAEVLSLVSTAWVYIFDAKFNPFYIGSKRDFIFDDVGEFTSL